MVVVGGGKGVTCVAAARAAGEHGRVTAFEGGAAQVDMALRTIALNRLSHLIDVHHAIVGPAISVYDSSADVKRIAASELPACDVLELDCEGAEVDILQNMTITPRVILVETHGMYGSTSPLCTALLEAKGYRVTPLGLAEPRVADYCEQNDIRILAGERSPMQEPAKAAKDLSPERRPEA
ncbi:hypothetical protein [Ancylobacter sp.]|uniref:hypothetical protein n=1 Tax=Ancylobacter sp. TaxID=1872567 RepID=UPI003D0F4A21